jgi:hypothetical protein
MPRVAAVELPPMICVTFVATTCFNMLQHASTISTLEQPELPRQPLGSSPNLFSATASLACHGRKCSAAHPCNCSCRAVPDSMDLTCPTQGRLSEYGMYGYGWEAKILGSDQFLTELIYQSISYNAKHLLCEVHISAQSRQALGSTCLQLLVMPITKF